MSDAFEPCAANPGVAVQGNVAFTRGGRKWTEAFHAAELAAAVLRAQGHGVKSLGTWLEHPASGYAILPQLVEFQALDDGGVQTVTTIQVNHATLAPRGFFEFQHSIGSGMADAISKGFEQWAQMDFVTLVDVLRPKPASCSVMEMEFPATERRGAMVRRAVLGPVAYFAERPPKTKPDEEPPFCPCCLLTKSFEAFKNLIEGDGFVGLRLYAARDQRGQTLADCRVNGEDFAKGAEALRAYASTWPPSGYEFRKQYVVMHTASLSR